MKFRELKADEVEARIASVKAKGVSILLYKNARCDMNILDECVGSMNWQRDHKELKGNMYAGVGIWDEDKKQWNWKWDCGKESYTEAEKGEASDSFKRACFNVGIGRELYTAPHIWFKAEDVNITDGKCFDIFEVKALEVTEGKITYLDVTDKNTKKSFIFGKSKNLTENNINDLIDEKRFNELVKLGQQANVSMDKMCATFNVQSLMELKNVQYEALKRKLNVTIAKKEVADESKNSNS